MAQPSRKILAAGGILLGKGAHEGQIAIVRRPRYGGEISLPKGKIKEGETEVSAALREVWEETGFGAKIKEYACAYPKPKPGRIDDGARRGLVSLRCGRSSASAGNPEHLYPMRDESGPHCNTKRKP